LRSDRETLSIPILYVRLVNSGADSLHSHQQQEPKGTRHRMKTAILWVRNDLRLADNPALTRAAQFDRLVAVHIHDPAGQGDWPPGAASRWWLHHSLTAYAQDLNRLGARLLIREGPSAAELEILAAEVGATHILWNRRYEPAAITADTAIKSRLRAAGYEVESFNAALLFEPWEIERAGGGPYRVFTAFWKACLNQGPFRPPLPAPSALPPTPAVEGPAVTDLGLLPTNPWDEGLRLNWTPGEAGALARLADFTTGPVTGYAADRDRPDLIGTSRLSPHLRFGEIGPRQVAAKLTDYAAKGTEDYLRQIGWREFAHHLLFHFPDTTRTALNTRFAGFPWRTDYADDLRLWQRGLTGVPLVDAGMRELWHTGWMHNRVRMVVASFLTKNLLIPWQEGARWFWDTLVDADLANNSLGWQWVAGSGADAAPYFRIFNPVLQGERYDPDGHYVRRWVPELAQIPHRHLHQPWRAPQSILATLPGDSPYGDPMVDLRKSRDRALAAYRELPR